MSARAAQVTVIGTAAADETVSSLAAQVGLRRAEAGAVVVCSGLGGVMEAAARGRPRGGRRRDRDLAGRRARGTPNSHCTHVVAAATGKARHLAVVASADAVIAIGGGWGTLSEIAHARAFGRPVVALGSWSVKPTAPMPGGEGIKLASDAAEAVSSALALAAAAR